MQKKLIAILFVTLCEKKFTDTLKEILQYKPHRPLMMTLKKKTSTFKIKLHVMSMCVYVGRKKTLENKCCNDNLEAK